jgi:MFS family permease
MFALSVAAISLAAANVVGFVALYALAGLLSTGQAPLPYAKAITSRFDAHRGLALGIAMAGVGVGTSPMPQVASFLLKTLDWREAYIVLGGLTLIAFPAAFFVNDLRFGETAIAVPTMAGDDVVLGFTQQGLLVNGRSDPPSRHRPKRGDCASLSAFDRPRDGARQGDLTAHRGWFGNNTWPSDIWLSSGSSLRSAPGRRDFLNPAYWDDNPVARWGVAHRRACYGDLLWPLASASAPRWIS